MIDEAALRRAERALRGYAALSRRRHDVGAYAVFLAPDPAHRFLNVAVPLAGAAARDPAAIAAMQAAFERAGAAPNLEYMAELHPGLTDDLVAAGLRLEGAAPAMTMALEALGAAPPASAEGRSRLLGPGDDALLANFLEAQARAFEMPDATWTALASIMRDGLRDGDVLALAWMQGDLPVAGATLLRGTVDRGLGGAVAELAGVWTHAELRGGGLGYAACHALLSAAASHGTAEVWLSAAEGAQGLYRRLGFRRIGTQHNVRR